MQGNDRKKNTLRDAESLNILVLMLMLNCIPPVSPALTRRIFQLKKLEKKQQYLSPGWDLATGD